eukprot:TRINITY_DN10326_c1_g1_i1.p1 TRINITY_DN10326_c1_g1~~TRINITY_DN10326_c1_g1_i1.p1  ORF type:complete len:1586 (+),score=788.66 TRINITY_DN10326_c1_g1_i1:138-4895(+)
MMNDSDIIDEDFESKFQMQSTPTSGSHQQRLPAYPGVDPERVARETEAKCTQLLADAEHRVLDERRLQSGSGESSQGRPTAAQPTDAHDKVQALLASFRSGVPNPVAAVLSQRSGAGTSPPESVSAGGQASAEQRIRYLERELAEREERFAAAEARHAGEKKELLSMRTQQLKLESTRKGQEGDMVNRAIATIAEYEGAVRKAEAENATRLSAYIERFTQDWLKRAREFEAAKGGYEGEVLEKAFNILKQQESILAEREAAVRQRILETLGEQSAERHREEGLMLEQFEKFKLEYKALQDRDFEARCSMYDEGMARQEAALFEKLSEERRKLIEKGRDLAAAGDKSQAAMLNEAMAHVTALREQVLTDAQKKQDEFYLQLVAHREEMQQEIAAHERMKADQIAEMQARVVAAMNDANRVVLDIKKQMADAEHQNHNKYLALITERQVQADAEQTRMKEALERDYFAKLEALADAHALEMKRVSEEHLAKQHDASSAAFKREQEIRMAGEAKTERLEEQIANRYRRELQEARDVNADLAETVASLERELSGLAAQHQAAVDAARAREAALEVKVAAARREAGEAKLAAEAELQERHQAWLDKALGEAHRATVDQVEYERMRRELDAADARCLELIRKEREAMHAQKEQAKEEYTHRLEEERERLERLEADLLDKVADMRVELEAEARRKEAANQRLFDTERKHLHEEAEERAAADRRDRQAFEERTRGALEARWKGVNEDLERACADRLATLAAQIEAKERDLAAREGQLQRDSMEHRQAAASRQQQREQDAFALRNEISAELRDEADARLLKERERLQAELETIRQQAAEQQKGVEEARLRMQAAADADRVKFERETSERYQRLIEQTVAEHNRAMHARELAEQQREAEAAERHRRAVHEVQLLHGQEVDRLNATLQQTRCDLEVDRAEREQELKAMHHKREEAIRGEAQAVVKAEQEALRQRELQMAAANDRSRLEAEGAARETVQKMFEHRQRQWEEADEERRAAALEFFTKMKAATQEKDEELLRRQKKFEEETRQFAEQALEEQRAQLKTAHVAEATRLAQENTHLRTQLAKCPTEREAEEARRRLQETHEHEAREERARHDQRVAEVAREFETKLAAARKALGEEREAAQLAAHRRSEEMAVHKEETGRQLQEKMDGLLLELRSMYERKWRAMQEQDLEKAAAFDRLKMEYEARMKQDYEKLLKEAERHYHDALEERGKQRSAFDREREALITELRHDIDLMKVHEQDAVEAKVRSRAGELQQQFHDEQQGYLTAVRAEKERREEAERAAAGLKQEVETLTASMNQWKLDLHKSLVAKYEALFNEVQARARNDRESFARKLLEEEERRLARELVRKDADLTRSRNEAERNAAKECEEREWKAQSVDLQHRMKRLFDAFGTKREKLTKLWGVIDTDPAEKAQLVDGVFDKLAMLAAMPPATASPEVDTKQSELEMTTHMSHCVKLVYEEVCHEVQRLEAQLPLMDVITRREFVKHRLREVLAAPPAPARDRQVVDLQRELQTLDAQLLEDLPKYEQTHNAKLYYKNLRYLHVMEQELRQAQHPQPHEGLPGSYQPQFAPAP